MTAAIETIRQSTVLNEAAVRLRSPPRFHISDSTSASVKLWEACRCAVPLQGREPLKIKRLNAVTNALEHGLLTV
jgi:hypothetical protein